MMLITLFFTSSLLQLNLRSQINIALKKVTSFNLTAGIIGKNYSEAIKNCATSDNTYKFMSTVKGTPACWQHILSDVLTIVKQYIYLFYDSIVC